jgi:hypothetical protein
VAGQPEDPLLRLTMMVGRVAEALERIEERLSAAFPPRRDDGLSVNAELALQAAVRTPAATTAPPAPSVLHQTHLQAGSGFDFEASRRLVQRVLDSAPLLDNVRARLIRLGWETGETHSLEPTPGGWIGPLIPMAEGVTPPAEGPLLLLPPGGGGACAIWVESARGQADLGPRWRMLPLMVDRTSAILKYVAVGN